MRRSIIAATGAAAALLVSLVAAPSAASAASGQSEWVPAPSAPWDRAAGVLCDFAIHAEATVDEVRMRVLARYPDGKSRSEQYLGDLVVRVTNTENGKSYDANASGSAIIMYGTDGSMTWYVLGPTLIGFREGSGNLPRGLWNLDGTYQLEFDAVGHKTLTMAQGTTDNVCTHLT